MGRYIHISEFKKGMILSSAVLNKCGQTLLKKDAELKDSHKDLFELWDIKHIYVESGAENRVDNIEAEIYAHAQNKLDNRLLWKPESAIERDLYETALKHLVNSL